MPDQNAVAVKNQNDQNAAAGVMNQNAAAGVMNQNVAAAVRNQNAAAVMNQNDQNAAAAAGRRTLADYTKPSLEGALPSIIRPKVASSFEIPTAIITMIQNSVQFDGLPEQDPNAHIALFLEICDTFKINSVEDDAVKLRLFPFSLRGQAKSWLNSLQPGSITTWAIMAEKFLFRFFPPSKTARLRNNIHAFWQDDEESLYEAWERFKELLRKCPHHGLERWQQVQTFYNGLNTPTRQTLDTMSGGSFNTRTPDEAIALLEELAINNYQWPTTRSRASTYRPVYQVDSNTALAAQVEALSSKIDRLQMNNFQDNSNGKGNHPNSSQKSNANTSNPPGFNQSPVLIQPQEQSLLNVGEADINTQPEKKKSLEDMMSRFLAMNETSHQENQNRFKEHELEIRNQKAVIMSIEQHLGQIASSLSEQQHVSKLKQKGEESKTTSEGSHNEEQG